MSGTDNAITPIPEDPASSAGQHIARGATEPTAQQKVTQNEWPPAYLGVVPSSTSQPLQLADVETIDSRMIPRSLPSDTSVEKKETNPLLNTWSAYLRKFGGHDYLVLPRTLNGDESYWRHDENMKYPSDKLLARKSYAKAFSVIYKEYRDARGRGRLIALGGTSGIGKSLFNHYVIWRLLHPDGVEVTASPRTILFCTDPIKDPAAYLFHDGRFYSVNSVGTFLATNAAANMFDGKDAWMIADGAPPPKVYHCPVLVSSSPGNFQIGDQKGAKKFFKCADLKVYLPPWIREEIWTVARVVYNIVDDDDKTLRTRFHVFGGIPRAVLKDYHQNFNLDLLFNVTDVATALAEVGSEELNHSKVSGKILHLIPDNTLTHPRYEWASASIMETAFQKLFQVTRKKIESFLQAGYGLHLGTFYGLMFEPFFHATITQQGYTGKFRRLTPPSSSESVTVFGSEPFSSVQSMQTPLATPLPLPTTSNSDATRGPRHWYGAKRHWAETYDFKIPRLSMNYFHVLNDIDVNSYNIPDRKNFAAVDSIAPSRGEMYQVTSAERHGIKGLHLRPLKKFFANHLASGQKVRLIFVVPPNRFEKFGEQKYLFPPARIDSDDGDNEANKQRSKKRKLDKVGADYDITEWDDLPYVEDGEVEVAQVQTGRGVDKGKTKKQRQDELQAELLKEVTEWVDQYVLEISVDPLAASAEKSVRQKLRTLQSSATTTTSSPTPPSPERK